MIGSPSNIGPPSMATSAKAGILIIAALCFKYQAKLVSYFVNASVRTKTFGTGLLVLVAVLTRFQKRIARKVKKEMTFLGASMEDGWTQRGKARGGGFTRSLEVWVFAISFLRKFLKSKKLEKTDPEAFAEQKVELAKELTSKILTLGPTFIKLGQLLSTRIDVLPKEYIKELVRLQDKVPGFSGEIAMKIIEKDLGKSVSDIYDTFDPEPIAAASLGQVHVATLDGKKLAVKVQRQGLKELFDMDLKNIRLLAKLLDKLDPKSDGAARDWSSIYDESARLLYKEIDYLAEAENSVRFKNNFANVPWVKVPDVYFNMTSTRVVTMEYVEGMKINDIEKIEAAGIDRELLAKRSAESYLTQICRHGYFHCDPHPGNLACDAVEGGRLIYYDFGMMDELKEEVRGGLVDLIFSIYENDPKDVCDSLEQIGVLKKNVDRVSVEKIARFFLSEFTTSIKPGEKWVKDLSKEEQNAIRKSRRQQLGADLFSVGSDVPFKFPPTFTFVFRAFTTLDGIGKGLDSKYDLTRLAQPFLKELIDLRDGSATLSFIKTWGKRLGLRPLDIKQVVMSPRNVARVEETLQKMEQGDLKVRVRNLESEKSFKRMELVQNNMGLALAATAFLNMGVMLSNGSPVGQMALGARVAMGLSGLFGVQVPIGLFKLNSLDKKFASFDK